MKAYYIPNGPKNLATFFPGIDFSLVKDYKIKVLSGATVIATTPLNVIGDCCDKARVRFLTYGGAIDGINFKIITKEHETKSDRKQTPTAYPLVKSVHGINRFNVKANDTLTLLNHDYLEDEMDWVNELLDSPRAWIEWNGTQGQDDSYIPIVIEDIKTQTIKQEERYIYEVVMQVKLSHEKFIIRN